MIPANLWIFVIVGFVFLVISTLIFFAKRYRRCPSDQVLVVFGSVGRDQASKCIHGGGTFVWPLIQDYSYLTLTPMTISIPLKNALSLQNIRIHVPSTFTVGISTQPAIMTKAAERLLGLERPQIETMAQEIIFGQLRLTVASLTIEQINQDRERFLDAIRHNVEPELNKIGLNLINVNVTDITDESDYIESIGKKAASEALNRAMVDVAEQDKLGAIGQSEAVREREIRVAQNLAASAKGQKEAEADKRIFLQQQEAMATIGESDATKDREIRVAENMAESEKGKKRAEADRRIYVQQQEAEAVKGENVAKANIAESESLYAVKKADADQRGEVARQEAEVEIQRAKYKAEFERLNAVEIVKQEAQKKKIEIAAEAEAERIRREAAGQAHAILLKYEAEAKGLKQILESKAQGYDALVKSCDGDAKAAATLLMIEKIEDIVNVQVEAIRNLKIDKVTVWDSGAATGGNGSSTSNFVSSLIKTLPPLHEIAAMAGVDLPTYLGKVAKDVTPHTQGKAPETQKADQQA